jgi:molybdenum cofactor cytidylyltransferase
VKFGSVPVQESEGCIVAHSIRQNGFVLKKGERVSASHIQALLAAGVESLVVARLEPDDIDEDNAAGQLAKAVAGAHVRVEKPFTGRANLFAESAGVLVVDMDRIDALNELDERITFATLPAYRSVEQGEMIGTVKIIPFAVPGDSLTTSLKCAAGGLVKVAPYRPLKVAVISTLLPGMKPNVIAKTLRVTAERLAPAGAKIVLDVKIAHDAEALRAAIHQAETQCDMIIVFGASAITDRRDVIPSAVETAGGVIEQLGMPVDPGNLLLVANLNGKPVLGAPGCARSPKENGFDWVLQRLLAGLPVRAADIRRMGVGGLLMEIVARGQLREAHGGQDD